MKLFRSAIIILLLLFTIVFNWNCNDNSVITTQTEPQQTDGPGDCTPFVWLNTLEYVQIQNPNMEDPTYEYRLIDAENCSASCAPYMTSLHWFSITTPPSPRMEGENTITTVSYGFAYGVNYCSYPIMRFAGWSGPDWPNCFVQDENIPPNQNGSYSNFVGGLTCMEPNTTYTDLNFTVMRAFEDINKDKLSE